MFTNVLGFITPRRARRRCARALVFGLGLGACALHAGCHPTTVTAPPSAYPPHTPSSQRADAPAWLAEPQRWQVGEWFEMEEDGDLIFGVDGHWKVRLVARTPEGAEWWESITWGDDAPRTVDALLFAAPAANEPGANGAGGAGHSGKQRLAVYSGRAGGAAEATGYPSGRAGAQAANGIESDWNLLENGNVIPSHEDFDDLTAEDDDIEVGTTVIHAQRLSFSKAMGPAEAVGRVWAAPEVPGKTIRVTADGYAFLIPVMSAEVHLVGYGRETDPKPELRLPEGAWPPRALARP